MDYFLTDYFQFLQIGIPSDIQNFNEFINKKIALFDPTRLTAGDTPFKFGHINYIQHWDCERKDNWPYSGFQKMRKQLGFINSCTTSYKKV
ncbi:unnamed protein product [Caenorhabditis brenneri]